MEQVRKYCFNYRVGSSEKNLQFHWAVKGELWVDKMLLYLLYARCNHVIVNMIKYRKLKNIHIRYFLSLRDRPFNLKGEVMVCFLFRSEFFFRTTQELEYFFLSRKANFFPQILTLGYMTKTLNQIIIFFLHQNQNIFFSNIGNQNIFFRKKP
jgi:hypothetical protein